MTDIVKWLRDERYDVCDRNMRCNGEVMEEAADEIERLRQQNVELVEVLKEIANADMFDDECKPTGGGYLINKARAAIAKATGGE